MTKGLAAAAWPTALVAVVALLLVSEGVAGPSFAVSLGATDSSQSVANAVVGSGIPDGAAPRASQPCPEETPGDPSCQAGSVPDDAALGFQLSTASATRPPGSSNGSLAWDPSLQEAVLFGGWVAGTFSNSTWILEGGEWREAALTGDSPPGRVDASMAYDAQPGVEAIVLYGGCGQVCPMNDTWLFNGTGWRMLPSLASGPAAVYSSPMTSWGMNGTLLYGGCLAAGCHRQSDATWAFQANATCPVDESSGCWIDVGQAAATRGAGPPGLAAEGLADDAAVGPANGTIVLFGGLNQSCADCARQQAQSTWFFDGWSWTNVTGPLSETAYPPAGFQLAFLFWDPVTDWVYAYGSAAAVSSPTELWGTDTLVWVNDSGLVTPVGPAYGSSIASGLTEGDGSELPAVVFGGNQSAGGASSNTWAFELGLSVTPGVTSSAPETNQSVGFFATVSGGDSPSGVWSFGDGGASNAVNATHAYRRAGVYQARLNVTDAVGVQSGGNVSLNVHTFTPGLSVPTAVDAGYPASFELSPSDGTSPYSATWLFPGSAPQTGLAVAHEFSSPGNYSIEVSVQDGTGTIVNLSRIVPVSDHPALIANATPSRIDVGVATQLVAFVTGGAAPFSYLWRLPDGRTSRLPNVSFTPETTGVMNATVNATDAAGVQLNESVELVVSAALSFTTSAVSVGVFSGRAMAFSVSITGGVAPYHYSWLFGDGASSSLPAPQHTFALSAVYLVNIWVNDSGGRSDHEVLAARVPHTSGGLIWDIESLTVYERLAIIGAIGAGLLVLILLAARKVRTVERRTNAPGSGPSPRRSINTTPEPPGPRSR